MVTFKKCNKLASNSQLKFFNTPPHSASLTWWLRSRKPAVLGWGVGFHPGQVASFSRSKHIKQPPTLRFTPRDIIESQTAAGSRRVLAEKPHSVSTERTGVEPTTFHAEVTVRTSDGKVDSFDRLELKVSQSRKRIGSSRRRLRGKANLPTRRWVSRKWVNKWAVCSQLCGASAACTPEPGYLLLLCWFNWGHPKIEIHDGEVVSLVQISSEGSYWSF